MTIPSSFFTIDWLRNIFAKNAPLEPTLRSHEIIPLTVDQGYLSKVYRVVLNWSKGDLPRKVVVKIPSLDGAKAALEAGILDDMASDFAEVLHNAECHFYHHFAGGRSPLPLAKCFFWEPETAGESGILVLEDLSDEGGIVPIFEGLNLPKCLNVASTMALLHAFSLKHPELWQNELLPRDRNYFNVLPKIFASVRQSLMEIDPEMELLLGKVEHLFTADSAYQNVNIYKEYNLPPVLIQGDPWSNNFFFKKSKDGTLSDELLAIVDWQEAQEGSLVVDLARFLVSSAPSVLRRQHWPQILRHYHQQLHFNFQKLGLELEIDLETLETVYKKQELFSLMYFTVEASMILTMPPFEDAEEGPGRTAAVLERLRAVLEDYISDNGL